MCARYVEQEIVNQGPETVAAVIGEPISTSNGDHVPSPRYWQMLREICDRHGVFLIMDEIINGFGRTGKLFASEHFGVVPDIMTIAKGLSSGYAPIAGVVVRPSVFEGFKEEGASIGHLLTFGGHAVATAAANKNLEILFREDLVARGAEQGAYLLSQLEGLRSHPTVGDVRGIGLMTCLELVKGPGSKEPWGTRHPYIKTLGETVHDKGLLTRVWDQLHVCPPLVVTRDEIDRMVAIIDESLTEVEAQFAGEIEPRRRSRLRGERARRGEGLEHRSSEDLCHDRPAVVPHPAVGERPRGLPAGEAGYDRREPGRVSVVDLQIRHPELFAPAEEAFHNRVLAADQEIRRGEHLIRGEVVVAGDLRRGFLGAIGHDRPEGDHRELQLVEPRAGPLADPPDLLGQELRRAR